MDSNSTPTELPAIECKSAEAGRAALICSARRFDYIEAYGKWIDSNHGQQVRLLAAAGRIHEALWLAFKEGARAAQESQNVAGEATASKKLPK